MKFYCRVHVNCGALNGVIIYKGTSTTILFDDQLDFVSELKQTMSMEHTF